MALLDRVKERTETDISDAELQLLIDEALQEIVDRYGPSADPAFPIVVLLEGDRERVALARPIDTAETVLVETVGDTSTELAADDWRVWHGGRVLERVATGTNPRDRWGDLVQVTYTPANDGNQRQEVAIKLVQAALSYRGLAREEQVGDVDTTVGDYHQERERLLRSLAPLPIPR